MPVWTLAHIDLTVIAHLTESRDPRTQGEAVKKKQKKWLRKADRHTLKVLKRLGQLQASGVAVSIPTSYAYHIRKHLKRMEEDE